VDKPPPAGLSYAVEASGAAFDAIPEKSVDPEREPWHDVSEEAEEPAPRPMNPTLDDII
jgi:hypothetical protein